MKNLSDWNFLGLVLVFAAIIRFIGISKSSFWHDEGYTMMMAPLPLAEIWVRTGLDVHPPLYYFTLHFWMQLFGTSELAVRSLSLVLMLGVIVFGFLLVRRLFDSRSARLSAVFLAIAPFLVRYSQEARMYGMLTFFAMLSTYLLVRSLQTKSWRDWTLYGLAIAGGLYTYYYVVFIILFHWAYMLFLAVYPRLSRESITSTILSKQWIFANALAVIIWLPWVPTAYEQLTTVQAPPWISKATIDTIPSTLAYLMIYNNMADPYAGVPLKPLRTFAILGLIAATLAFMWQRRRNLQPVMLMVLFMAMTPILVWLMSFGEHPKYVDRYFVFAAAAFYAFLGILFTQAKPWANHRKTRIISIAIALIVFSIGVYSVNDTNTHSMRQLVKAIDEQGHPKDPRIAGNFYTFFDFRYYNLHNGNTQVYVPHNFPGCCEGKSMLHDKTGTEVVKDLNAVKSETGYVWIFGNPGDQSYFKEVPASWQPVGERIERRTLAAQRYRITQ